MEIGTTDHLGATLAMKRALSHLETLCGIRGGYEMGEPGERAGWSFFTLKIGPGLRECIESKFADMIGRYRGGKPDDKLAKFMTEYFESKGAEIKLKIVRP